MKFCFHVSFQDACSSCYGSVTVSYSFFFFSSLIKLFYHLVTSRFNCIDSCDFLSFYQLPLSFFLDYTTHITCNTFMGASYLKFPLLKK